MIKDYYDILSLRKDASINQINQQYKRLVLRWHPRFAKQDQKTAYHNFSSISEAYEVLSDPLKRAFYDKYGYLKLKEGLFADGKLKGGYRFAENPDQIFQKFFHENNSLAQSVDREMLEKGSLFGSAYGGLNYKSDEKVQDLVVNVTCNLHELYLGVAKTVAFERKILNLDGRTTSLRPQVRMLQIKPGYSSETPIIFKGQGHQSVSRVSSDLIFKIVQEWHLKYTRKGKDLFYVYDISLIDALNSQTIEIRTLDNRLLRLPMDEIITPRVIKEVEGQGMPSPNGRGNLYIRFNIIFPSELSQQKRAQLRRLLD